MSVMLPLVLLGVAELALRLFGLGGYPPVFVKVGSTPNGTVVITDTPGAASFFFANRSKPGSIDQYTFLSPKPKNTVRIMLCGESAAKGFPQPMALACSAFLKEMLSDAWPDRTVEVINLGTTAIASFPVLEIMTESLAYEPDLVVAYVGNNEFFGAYGVSSLHSAGRSPQAMRVQRALRSLALVQGLDRLVHPPAGAPDRTLMEVMIGQAYIGPDDPLRTAAAGNLGTHVGQMIERCKARNVPILVCTLACNERDLAPLGTCDLSSLPPADQQRVAELLATAAERMSGSTAAAIEPLTAALRLAPHHARAHYLLGQALFASGRPEEAAAEFHAAVDLDPMPWRPPDSCIAAIRQAATEHGAVLCDVQQAFREASPGGCIGWELMDDHVHPSLAGQALLARAVVKTLTGMPGPLAVSPAAYQALPSTDEYALRLGDNPYDRYAAAHTLRVLCNIPFFRETNPGAFERHNRVVTELELAMPAPVREAARDWQKPATHAGAQRPISGIIARVLMRTQQYSEAERLLRVAQRCVPLYSSWNLEYVYFMLACREKMQTTLNDEDRRIAADAIERGRFLLQLGRSESGMAERYVGRMHQLRGEFAEAIPLLLAARKKVSGMDLVATDAALIDAYVKTGDVARARALATDGIEHSGEFAEQYRRFLTTIPGN